MIEGNVLKFGYGDICVHTTTHSTYMDIRQFKPPVNPGDYLHDKDIEYIGDFIFIKFNYKDCIELEKLLDSVKNRDINVFEFKGYIFDFTNYNEGSIKTLKESVNRIISSILPLFAC